VDKADTDAWFDNIAKGSSGATPYDMYQQIMGGTGLQPIGTCPAVSADAADGTGHRRSGGSSW
jgi:hypothetical protein